MRNARVRGDRAARSCRNTEERGGSRGAINSSKITAITASVGSEGVVGRGDGGVERVGSVGTDRMGWGCGGAVGHSMVCGRYGGAEVGGMRARLPTGAVVMGWK